MPEYNESNSANNDLEKLTHRLARANGFNLDALDANRRGKLIASQKAKFLAIFVVATVAGLVLAILLIVSFVREADRLEGAWWLIPIVLAIFALSFLLLRSQFNTLRDYLEGKVVSISGVVTKDEVSSLKYDEDRSTSTVEFNYTFYYKVKRKRFKVNDTGYLSLREGLRYRLFFLPRCKKLINIEAINDNDSSSQ